MELRLLRAAYTIEFLVALVATLEFWSQVGGQNHMDLMPWWWKALLSLSIATAVVKMTVAVHPRQILIWLLVLVLLLIGGGVTTYYFHLYEPQDEAVDEDQVTPTSLQRNFHLPRPVRNIHQQVPIIL
jgi:ABC-type multidrug transport system permease subunit